MRSRIKCVLAGGLIAAATAGSAQATYFSIASDVNSNSFSFAGSAGSSGSFLISDFSRPNTYTLLIDDDNGPLPAIPLTVEFHASLTADAGQSTHISGPLYLHSYRVTGTFGFYDADGNAVLTATIGNNAALLTVPGTQTAWSSTGAVLGADSYADVTYTASAELIGLLGGDINAAKYGLVLGSSGPNSTDDFGFDLTVINASGGPVAIDADTKAPISAWSSESSFSGHTQIPAPSSAALMGLGMLAAGRRRR